MTTKEEALAYIATLSGDEKKLERFNKARNAFAELREELRGAVHIRVRAWRDRAGIKSEELGEFAPYIRVLEERGPAKPTQEVSPLPPPLAKAFADLAKLIAEDRQALGVEEHRRFQTVQLSERNCFDATILDEKSRAMDYELAWSETAKETAGLESELERARFERDEATQTIGKLEKEIEERRQNEASLHNTIGDLRRQLANLDADLTAAVREADQAYGHRIHNALLRERIVLIERENDRLLGLLDTLGSRP